MPDKNPSTDTANGEQEQDYSQMTEEQLDQLLRDGHGVVTQEDPPQEAAPEEPPDEGPPPQEEAAPVEEEPKAEDEAPQEAAEEEEPLDERALELEELRIEVQRAKAKASMMEDLAGRNAGQMGFLRKQLDQLGQATAPAEQTDEYGEQTPVARAAPATDPFLQSRLAELEGDQRQRGVVEEWNEFVAANPQANERIQELTQHVQKHIEPYKDMELNTKSLRKVTRLALDSAWSDIRLDDLRKAREEAKTKKAAQVSERKTAKQAASVSGSGATPAPKPKQKAVEDMTAEEADKEMIRLYGDGHYRRASR